MADSGMDEFAQTRGADDLFDDEIIPISAEEQQTQTEVIAHEPEPEQQEVPVPEEPAPEQPIPRGETPQRGRGGERGRGRRGRGKGARGGRESEQKRSESSSRKKSSAQSPASDVRRGSTSKGEKSAEPKEQPGPVEEGNGEEQSSNGAEAQRVPAVRGDRSATGGLRKPKLTEAELSKRIAAAKENALKKAAAHARAEADQASFMEREQEAAKKRREEAAHRQLMDNEREQNRQRKLKAQTGREWDSQKREEDYNPRGGGSQFRRGMHGGVSGVTRRNFEGSRPEDAADHQSSPRDSGWDDGWGDAGGRDRGSPRASRGSTPPGGTPRRKGLAGSRFATESPVAGLDDKSAFPALPERPKEPETKPTPKSETKLTADTNVNAEPASEARKSPSAMDKLDSTFSPLTGTWADQFDDGW
ncbi:uncharacterized protein N7515_005521 [Penicillium bovifimosum]|uniref:Uncharacterized protein n=1 Tax=Penicillium bovifimosum TaxID=126998 RepID=A0A9W9L0A1_9EURO|nr:uncharacterized protein N7515_005521 [Penicillium bovifimosum]KAJ5129482.1 hypothetical protein N7515_005521 [Penicillium bovifimosum]